MKSFDAVFLSASLSACAAACRLGRKGLRVLLIEKGILTAPEYTASFQAAEEQTEPAEQETRSFCQKLCERNIITEHGLVCPAIHPALCEELKSAGVTCLFRARVRGISQKEGRFLLRLVSLGVHLEVESPVFCDCTPDCLGERLLGKAPARCENRRFLSFVTTEGPKGPVHYRTLPVSGAEKGWKAAALLYERKASPPWPSKEKICGIAGRIGVLPLSERPRENRGCISMPPAYTLQQAYDAGIQTARAIEEAQYGAL